MNINECLAKHVTKERVKVITEIDDPHKIDSEIMDLSMRVAHCCNLIGESDVFWVRDQVIQMIFFEKDADFPVDTNIERS